MGLINFPQCHISNDHVTPGGNHLRGWKKKAFRCRGVSFRNQEYFSVSHWLDYLCGRSRWALLAPTAFSQYNDTNWSHFFFFFHLIIISSINEKLFMFFFFNSKEKKSAGVSVTMPHSIIFKFKRRDWIFGRNKKRKYASTPTLNTNLSAVKLKYWIGLGFLTNRHSRLIIQCRFLQCKKGNRWIRTPYQQHYLISFQEGFRCGF